MIVIDRYTTEYSDNGIGPNAASPTWQDTDTPQITAWSCNHHGQMTAETNVDNHPVTCSYDGDSQQLPHPWARQVNGAPLVTTCSYDAAGRQTGYSDGVPPAVILTLNFLDRQTSVTDAAGTRNFTYDAAHRLANEKNPLIVNGLLSHTYAPTVRTATIGNGTDTRTDAYMPETWDIASSSRQTADPLGYPDGWNNFAYCNNSVVEYIDFMGGSILGGCDCFFSDCEIVSVSTDTQTLSREICFVTTGCQVEDPPSCSDGSHHSVSFTIGLNGNLSFFGGLFTVPIDVSISSNGASHKGQAFTCSKDMPHTPNGGEQTISWFAETKVVVQQTTYECGSVAYSVISEVSGVRKTITKTTQCE